MPAKTNPPTTATALNALLRAAEDLLGARENQMVTSAEWDALNNAVAAGRAVMPKAPTEPDEMLATLEINKTSRRAAGAGTWVTGNIAGHAFEALVFPEHAESESYELDRSRISKLHVQEHFTHRQVAAFDRGWDMKPATDAAQQIVDLLSAGLAETVYGK